MPLKLLALTVIAFTSVATSAAVQVTDSRPAFVAASGPQLQVEDWTTHLPETLLDGQTLRGVTYSSTSSELLVVGTPHGPGWILGYSRGAGRYASFSFETISFAFSEPVYAFGIALSQGNSSGSTNYNGSSEWRTVVDQDLPGYQSVAAYTTTDFTGETYLGLTGFSGATTFSITRLRSDANIVWDIREIAWVSAVPEPSTGALALLGVLALACKNKAMRRRAEA
jgi:hypothetical protein